MSDPWDGYLPSEVASAINRDRMAKYGDPRPNYVVFAGMLSAYFGIKVTPEDAVAVMMLLKIMREKCGGFLVDYNDNLEDICGFANVLHVVKERRAPADGTSEREGPMGTGQLPG